MTTKELFDTITAMLPGEKVEVVHRIRNTQASEPEYYGVVLNGVHFWTRETLPNVERLIETVKAIVPTREQKLEAAKAAAEKARQELVKAEELVAQLDQAQSGVRGTPLAAQDGKENE